MWGGGGGGGEGGRGGEHRKNGWGCKTSLDIKGSFECRPLLPLSPRFGTVIICTALLVFVHDLGSLGLTLEKLGISSGSAQHGPRCPSSCKGWQTWTSLVFVLRSYRA